MVMFGHRLCLQATFSPLRSRQPCCCVLALTSLCAKTLRRLKTEAFARLVAGAQPGDHIYAAQLHRLNRNLKQLGDLLHVLKQKQIDVFVLDFFF